MVVGMLTNSGINARLRRFLRSREGNIAIISGLMMPAIVGFCGLASETAFWYYRHRDIQGAADVAAFGATVVLRRGGNADEVEDAATADAAANGWHQASGTIVVNTPPTSGAYQNNLSVEVLLTENQQRYFTRFFFGNTTVPIRVRAIGTYASAGPACFLALHPTASHAMEFWGNSTANFTSCNVVANSNAGDGLAVGGAANVIVPCAQVVGGSDVTATLTLTDCTTVSEGAEATPDPYLNLPEPDEANDPCGPGPDASGYAAGRHCGGISVSNNVTFAPGVHVIDGGELRFNANANVTANGVMFYLTNGATIAMNGNAHMEISAMNSGTYSGIAFFGDRTQAYAVNLFNGNSTSYITGALYFPSQDVTFSGNYSGQNDCMQVVALTIEYTGSAEFGTDCSGTGLYQIPTPGVIALVE